MTTASAAAPASPLSLVRAATTSRAVDNVPLGALRAAVTVLVLAHHSVIAYLPIAPPPPASLVVRPRLWGSFPVVDGQRWAGFIPFVWFNDIFAMALLFFVSGLFVWRSLRRKGSARFLRDRALRLGLPFVVAAALIAPLAYYPSYLQTGARRGLGGFAGEWLSLGSWPAGPAWFIWLLLLFDAGAAGLFAVAGPQNRPDGAQRGPVIVFALLVAVSAVAYVPMLILVGPFHWTEIGPFAFQTSRVFLYAVYFLAGVAVGARDLDQGLLAPDGELGRLWPLWLLASLLAFSLTVYVTALILALPTDAVSAGWAIAGGSTFVLSCAASSFLALALYVRFVRRHGRALDSLRDNAYGMYLIHYAFVTWLQLALLAAPLLAAAKGLVVCLATVALSWGATAALRRVPGVARVI